MTKLQNEIEEVSNKIEFATAIALFLPTLIYSLSKLGGSEQQANDNSISWSFLICGFLFTYVLFKLSQKYISNLMIKLVNILIYMWIVSVSVLIWFVVKYKVQVIAGIIAFIPRIITAIVVFIPPLLALFIFVFFVYKKTYKKLF